MPPSPPHIMLFAGPFQLRGTCSYTMRLIEHLPKNGFTVSVNCTDADLIRRQMPGDVRLREYRRLTTPIWGRAVRHMMYKDVESKPPDLLHIQSRQMWQDGRWLARRLQRPYVVTVHDHLYDKETFGVDFKWCRKIIAVSESVKANLLERTSFAENQIAVIHTGVGMPDVSLTRPPLQPGHVPVVGTAGPLEAVKGFPFFLSAAQQVLASGRDVEFLIAGAGPEEANLRRLTRELGITQKVTFVPNFSELNESLSAMDIFCLPSLQQGLGTIMLEPMAMAKPVIATGVGGVYSVVEDGRTGLMVPPSNSQALAEKILDLLNHPDRARAIGEAARARVLAEFSIEKMIDQTAGLYREILDAEKLATPVAVKTTK
ncbi:glycosyltransferase family 4 protein [Symmachiella dynata]|nr:glycosyltransferase family 4 protein [Symmachiella dynata]